MFRPRLASSPATRSLGIAIAGFPPLFGTPWDDWGRRETRGGAEEAGVEPTEDACAPSNVFEARAPHRERYSSARQNAAVLPVIKGVSGKAPILLRKTGATRGAASHERSAAIPA